MRIIYNHRHLDGRTLLVFFSNFAEINFHNRKLTKVSEKSLPSLKITNSSREVLSRCLLATISVTYNTTFNIKMQSWSPGLSLLATLKSTWIPQKSKISSNCNKVDMLVELLLSKKVKVASSDKVTLEKRILLSGSLKLHKILENYHNHKQDIWYMWKNYSKSLINDFLK